ncbi:hypothetical protein [Fusibacter ferrireducens]|uniref:YtxH domain-containing protein n=1 Tax=Fusibacter ferrireducens TaxID=2785058 RepID=A0ABR9ZTD5_9FIRM|nr:hypothetical protein [Fusibacter ferrireducens]MBF4693710.1 hypothetical protein [Fusibacter ferrireducens]
MFKYAKKMEEERKYYEDMLARSEQRQTANLLVGLAIGAVAGYCAKKYVLPKLAETEYKERLSEETDLLKDRFNDLKHSFLSLKDKLPFGDCCDDLCCCGDSDEDCCCDDECCCEDDKDETEPSETTEESPAEPSVDDEIEKAEDAVKAEDTDKA